MKKNSLLKLVPGTLTEIDHSATATAVRAARVQRAVSQYSLSEALGISASYLSDLEKGKRNWSEKLVNAVEEAL